MLVVSSQASQMRGSGVIRPGGQCRLRRLVLNNSWIGANIEDVKRLLTCLRVSALGLVLLMFSGWAYRELRLRYAEWKYTREFTPGMKRQDIENRLLSEGIRFWPEPPLVEFVSLGYEVSYSPVCSPREAALLLEFEVHDGTPSGADVLRRVKPVRQERGCL